MFRYRNPIFICFLSLSIVHGQDPGFFLDDWHQKAAILPLSQWKEKPGNEASLQVRVDAGEALKKIPTYVYGNNAVTWGGNMNLHPTIMKDINQLKPHVLRWPGGNLSQEYFWNLSSDQPPEDVPENFSPRYGVNDDNWQMSTGDFYDLLKNTSSTGSICVNYSYARYGTGSDPVAKAAHLAADWVRYDQGRTKFWEIGNENFGKWEAGYEIDISQNQDGQPRFISGQLYGEHCRVFIDSMRAAAAEVGADIRIGVVAFDAESSYDPIQSHWNEGMMPEVGDLADFLIVHSYFTPYNQDSGIPTILNSHDVVQYMMEDVVNDMHEAGKAMIPVALTEWNIFAVGSMQQVSYINGMHAALVLGELIQNDYGMATRWDLTNGWNNGNDHGMFSRGGEPGVDYYNPRPVFFYMKYFQDYFGDHLVASSVIGNEEVIAYASTFSSGEAGMVLINKGVKRETVQLDLENHDTGARYYTMTLTGGDDNGDFSRKVFLNGTGGDEQGGGPDDYERVKAYSSSTREGILVDLPPLSVVYLMVETRGPLSYVSSKTDVNPELIQVELSEEVMPLDDPTGFEVLLNGQSVVGITGIERDPDSPYLLNITLDRILHRGDELLLSYSGGAVVTSQGVSLPAFNQEKVRNLLPGDPHQITFELKSASSQLPIADCEVSFNGTEAFTNDSGRAIFSEPQGSYPFSARKTHLEPKEELFSIYSDTLFTLELDSLAYQVEFLLTDLKTGKALAGVEVTTASEMASTRSEGKATFLLFAGSHHFAFEALNYLGRQSDHVIASDTAFSLALEQSHARVKLKLKDGSQAVNKALVRIGDDTLYSSQLGICMFESISLEQSLDYQVQKDAYYPLRGTLRVGGDTTLSLQMVKSVARVTFELSSEWGPAADAMVIIAQDTVLVNAAGICTFYRLQKEEEHLYRIFADAYETFTGSLRLVRDTTVYVELSPSGGAVAEGPGAFNLYPNPASDQLFIECGAGQIREVELLNLQGKRMSLKVFGSPQKSLKLALDVPSGVYILQVRTAKEVYSSRIVVCE